MKRRTLTLTILSVLSVFGLASCGNDKKSESKSTAPVSEKTSEKTSTTTTKSTTPVADHSLKYQYTGKNTEMADYGFAYSIYLNFYADGTLDGGAYDMYSLNTEDASTNTNLHKWYTGKWKLGKDDNDDEAITASVSYVDGVKYMAGDAATGKQTLTISFASDGKTPLNLSQFNVPLGLSGRAMELQYNATPYATLNDFINASVYHFEAPANVKAYFDDVENKERLYMLPNGEGEYFGAVLNEDKTLKGYYPKSSFSWGYSQASGLTVSLGGKNHQVVIEGTKGTISYEEALYGNYKSKHNFVCEDVTPLTSEDVASGTTYEKGTVYFTYKYMPSYDLSSKFFAKTSTWMVVNSWTKDEASTDELFAFTNEDSNSQATFVLLKNGSFKFHNTLAGNAIDKVGTFEFANYKFTFTTTDGSVETVSTDIQA